MATLSIIPTGDHEPTAQQLSFAASCALLLFRERGLTLDVIEQDQWSHSARHREIRRAWRIALTNAIALCETNDIHMVITRR